MTKKQNPETVYRAYDAAFADVCAWTVFKDGECVGKIATKLTGRRSPVGLTVRAYVQVFGMPMVRGTAKGGGYDMKTAAIAQACRHITSRPNSSPDAITRGIAADLQKLVDQGYDIPKQLRDMGYIVEQVL